MSDVIALTTKSDYVHLRRVNAGVPPAAAHAHRLLAKRDALRSAAAHLREAKSAQEQSDNRDQVYFGALLAACTHFRLFKGGRALQADLSYASAGSPQLFTANLSCNLRMATEMEADLSLRRRGAAPHASAADKTLGDAAGGNGFRTSSAEAGGTADTHAAPATSPPRQTDVGSSPLLHANIPIALRAASAVHVFVCGKDDVPGRVAALPVPPTLSTGAGWLERLNTARKHVFDRELFERLASEGLAGQDSLAVSCDDTLLTVALDDSRTLVVRLMEGAIEAEDVAAASVKELADGPVPMDSDDDAPPSGEHQSWLATVAAMALRASHRGKKGGWGQKGGSPCEATRSTG